MHSQPCVDGNRGSKNKFVDTYLDQDTVLADALLFVQVDDLVGLGDCAA